MKQNNSEKLAKEWFRIGDNEFGFAKLAFEDFGSFYPQICFQCQQVTEKYLKGFLVYHQQKFHKIHDLTELSKLCAKIDKEFLNFLPKTDILSQYYLTSRYPLQYREAGKKEAKQALEIAKEIIEFIKIKLRY